MLVATPLVSDNAPLVRIVSRGCGRIVWQQRYDGIAHVAYRGGKAIAGVSGPWSDRYVLIWWDERPAGSNPLELFETLEAARCAVARGAGEALPAPEPAVASVSTRRRTWWHAFRPSRSHRIAQLRRRWFGGELDLSGLNFCALR